MEESKNKLVVYNATAIQRKIYTIRNVQVMFDSDLAEFYGVNTKRLNEQVLRNIERFPEEFMFRLADNEYEDWKSQIVTSNQTDLRSQNATSNKKGGRRYLPYVFTEQGVAMLSGVLRSETAVKMSIQIINAFVAMRKFIVYNAQLFQRIDNVERRQLEHEIKTDKKFNEVFDALQSKELDPKQGIFYDGQIFDAYKFVSGLIRKAEKSILLIDNYIDETVLSLFTKRKHNVAATIFTKEISKPLSLDITKFNSQYQPVEVKIFKNSHDRFMVIDNKDVYHFGSSLKDLGKKWFAFSKFDKGAVELLQKLNEKN